MGDMRIFPGTPLFWVAAPVRAHVFFGFFGMFQGLDDLEGGGGLADEDWW